MSTKSTKESLLRLRGGRHGGYNKKTMTVYVDEGDMGDDEKREMGLSESGGRMDFFVFGEGAEEFGDNDQTFLGDSWSSAGEKRGPNQMVYASLFYNDDADKDRIIADALKEGYKLSFVQHSPLMRGHGLTSLKSKVERMRSHRGYRRYIKHARNVHKGAFKSQAKARY